MYKYSLLQKLVKTDGPLLTSPEDTATMKLIFIAQRPAKRDRIYIFISRKFLALREGRRVRVLDKNFSWRRAKEKIFEEARRHQLGMIKK